MTRRLLLTIAPLVGLSGAQNPEKGTVYIYRLRIFQASARRMTLSIDGHLFAYLQNGRYLVAHLPAGKHVLSDKDSALNIELPVEAGETLYVNASFVENGLFGFGFNTRFSVQTKESGESDLRRLKPGDRKEIVKVLE